MATEKEREIVREIVDFVMDLNDSNKSIKAQVEIRDYSVCVHISKYGESGFLYFAEHPAYFESGSFTFERFESQCEEFLKELRKHHKDYDADGIRLEVAK